MATPYIDTPPNRPTFVRCGWCERLSIELTADDPMCPECGWTGICAQCGDGPLDHHDLVAPQACSDHCKAELDAQDEADNRYADRI